jgi:phosphatidylglycerophosphate synthase
MRKIDASVENPIDNVFISMCEHTAEFYHELGMIPNHLTTISLCTGLLSAYMFYKKRVYVAIALFTISYYFDCVDGYYARSYDMVTSFGDVYDHVSDVLKHVVILGLMYSQSTSKTLMVLPVLGVLVSLSFVHLGCQEKIYNTQDDQPMIEMTKQACIHKEHIVYTRWFGCGTFEMVFALSMLYFQ